MTLCVLEGHFPIFIFVAHLTHGHSASAELVRFKMLSFQKNSWFGMNEWRTGKNSEWLLMQNGMNGSNEKISFLVIHTAGHMNAVC